MSTNWNCNIEKSNLQRVESTIRIKRKAKYSTFDKRWKKIAKELNNLQSQTTFRQNEAKNLLKKIERELKKSKGLHFLGVFAAKKFRKQRKEIKDQLTKMIEDIKYCRPERKQKIYLREILPKYIKNTLPNNNNIPISTRTTSGTTSVTTSGTTSGSTSRNGLKVELSDLLSKINTTINTNSSVDLNHYKSDGYLDFISKVKIVHFVNKSNNDKTEYIKRYIKEFSKNLCEIVKKIPIINEERKNFGMLNILRSLKFGTIILTEIIKKSKGLNRYNQLFPNYQFVIMLLLSNIINCAMRLNDNENNSDNKIKLTGDSFKNIYGRDLSYNIYGNNNEMTLKQLVSSIFYQALIKLDFNRNENSDKNDEIKQLSYGLIYNYDASNNPTHKIISDCSGVKDCLEDVNLFNYGTNPLPLTQIKNKERNKIMKMFIYYVISVSGQTLQNKESSINTENIKKLFELFGIDKNTKKSIFGDVIKTIQKTEYKNGTNFTSNTFTSINNTNINNERKLKTNYFDKLGNRFKGNKYNDISNNFEDAYTEIGIEGELVKLLEEANITRVQNKSYNLDVEIRKQINSINKSLVHDNGTAVKVEHNSIKNDLVRKLEKLKKKCIEKLDFLESISSPDLEKNKMKNLIQKIGINITKTNTINIPGGVTGVFSSYSNLKTNQWKNLTLSGGGKKRKTTKKKKTVKRKPIKKKKTKKTKLKKNKKK